VFSAPISYPTAGPPGSVFAHDLDGDGDVDLCVCPSYTGALALHVNAGDGSFATHNDITSIPRASSVAFGDWDPAGEVDLAIVDSGGGSGVLNEQVSPLNFTRRAGFALARTTRVILGVDVDGDGDLDLATSGGERLTVLRNVCP
jgi:hypothetical protein